MAQPLFSTIITPTQFTIANNNTVLALALGAVTMVICTTTASLSFLGITAVGGNVDGMLVTIQNISSGNFGFSFSHDLGVPASSGFLNVSSATYAAGARYGAATYRYLAGTTNRWLAIGKA